MLHKLFLNHRYNPLIRFTHNKLMNLHYSFENVNYNCNTNGEKFVVERIASLCDGNGTLFDVGANNGEWTTIGLSNFPHGEIHAFEVVPDTFLKLKSQFDSQNSAVSAKLHLNNVGLGERSETTLAYFSPNSSGLATCLPDFTEQFHGFTPESRSVNMVSGDQYCSENSIESITLLKIDVEGFEPQVIRGFGEMLRNNRIDAVQFEYGRVNIHTHFLLKDFYNLFLDYDMVLGKIYPNSVDFKPYKYEDEDFLGPNYLAVRSDRTDMINRLRNGH
jgi:FkbM family methyltransferase